MVMSEATVHPLLGDLGRPIADRAEDRRVLIVDPAHAAEVDQAHLVADLDDVVRQSRSRPARDRGDTEKAGRISMM